MWIESLLSKLKVKTNKATLWCDNLSTVNITANPILHSRTKNIELDLYFIREQVLKGKINVNHVLGAYQRADILTKAISANKFNKFKNDLNLSDQIDTKSTTQEGKYHVTSTSVNESKLFIPDPFQSEEKPHTSLVILDEKHTRSNSRKHTSFIKD